MLLVDYREGSADLLKPLQRMGLPAEETDLGMGEGGPVADLAFTGQGPGGKAVSVGVEFKKLGELVGSLRTERLQGEQLLSMRRHYDFCWLLIEGELLYDQTGRLLRRAGRRSTKPLAGSMTVGELQKRILGLHLRGGLNPWHTQTRKDSLKWIEALYRTWTDTAWDEHTSHLGIFQPPTPIPVSPFRQIIIKHIPGVGYRGSRAVEKRFGGDLGRAWNATLHDWSSIEVEDAKGRKKRLGDTRAAQIMQIIRGR